MPHKQTRKAPNRAGPTMHIKIHGPHVNTQQSSPDTRIWRPSDELKGRLVISSAVNLDFTEIHVFFEGIARTWITAYRVEDDELEVRTGERKFLAQAHYLEPTNIHRVQTSPSAFDYSISYNFVIPEWVVSSSPSAIGQCLALPPSIDAGELHEDKSSGKAYMQPSIKYAIRAEAQCNDGSGGHAIGLKSKQGITLVPFAAEQPPLDIGDYPAEFKPVATGKLNKLGLFGGVLARMSATMKEPLPLRYTTSASHISSESRVRLALETVKDATQLRPQDWKCIIELQLHVKTYYSVRPLPRIPSKVLLTGLGYVRLRSEHLQLGTHERTIPWQMNVGHGHNGALPLSSNLTFTADLPLRIEYSGVLLPNFCSPLVARLYAVRVRMRFRALRHEPFELEVPIQVVHPTLYEDGDPYQDEHFVHTDPLIPPKSNPFEGHASDSCHTPPPRYLR